MFGHRVAEMMARKRSRASGESKLRAGGAGQQTNIAEHTTQTPVVTVRRTSSDSCLVFITMSFR